LHFKSADISVIAAGGIRNCGIIEGALETCPALIGG
jgi:hypothetical protein